MLVVKGVNPTTTDQILLRRQCNKNPNVVLHKSVIKFS